MMIYGNLSILGYVCLLAPWYNQQSPSIIHTEIRNAKLASTNFFHCVIREHSDNVTDFM